MAFPFSRHDVRPDEEVLVYSTWARWDAAAAQWCARIAACVFEPELDSAIREALTGLLRRVLGISGDAGKGFWFRERIRLFLVDHERGKDVSVRIGSSIFPVGRTKPDGQAAANLLLPKEATAPCISPAAAHHHGWLQCDAVLPENDPRRFFGRIQCIPPRGVSIISDLDDTMKLTQVTDRRLLLANTFLKPWAPIPNMPALYRRWEAKGAAFHYVSSGPWQLYPASEEFRADAHFPTGSWTLRPFRLTDRSVWHLFAKPTAFKIAAITRLLTDYPQRRFVLVGDSGEQDAEIYAQLAQSFPDQVLRIFIRDCPEAPGAAARCAATLARLPAEKWKVFRDPEELEDAIPREAFH